jgi:regulator of protease activity HflC (stomatin/prohibitin superfamily)
VDDLTAPNTLTGVKVPDRFMEAIRSEGRAQREARIRRIRAEGIREEAQIKKEADLEKVRAISEALKEGITASEMIALRYVEALEKRPNHHRLR